MFDTRIEIISPGELLRPLTIENLENLDYKPKSRNKTIADVFLRRRLMDKRGSGILRIIMAMLGKRIREIVGKKFNWDNIIEKYVKVYEKII